MPLDVDKGIELPQLELISTKNDDCTTEYSTGIPISQPREELIQCIALTSTWEDVRVGAK
jgi:hypothetical protein